MGNSTKRDKILERAVLSLLNARRYYDKAIEAAKYVVDYIDDEQVRTRLSMEIAALLSDNK